MVFLQSGPPLEQVHWRCGYNCCSQNCSAGSIYHKMGQNRMPVNNIEDTPTVFKATLFTLIIQSNQKIQSKTKVLAILIATT